MSPASLLRFWASLDGRVGRREYLLHGAALMAFKYAVDAAFVWTVAGRPWTPLEYLSPFFMDRAELLDGSLLPWIFVVWTLPFLWAGITLTLRRAVDAGWSPWAVLFFFVPFLNYLLIAALCAAPSKGRELRPGSPDADERERFRSALLGVGLSVVFVVGMTLRSRVLIGPYGSTLFLGTPFLMGVVAAWAHNREHPRALGETLGVVALGLAVGAGATLLLALEGALCILMAFPLAFVVAALGGLLGRAIALRSPTAWGPGTPLALLVPLAVLPSVGPERAPALREVVSAVEIDAPPEVVWRHVVGFSEIPGRPALGFRLGIAYPVRARIEGEGVGAVRRCEFSTGAFVEPITAWEPPSPGRPSARLAFDVIEQPAPLEEWSPYNNVHPPHLDGYFRSRKGEFRLTALPGGGTRLEGSTWYELDLHPRLYWHAWSDALVRRIHGRVLAHVAELAEMDAATPVPEPRP